MRDTSDMMEDVICEDTMMECSGDGGGLEDLVNLASDIADSAPSIRAAAERLLTLLGVDEDDDASSSEDEGVELDSDDSENEEPQDVRLLHQLAASLAQELKYAKQNISNAKLAQVRTVPEIHGKDSVQSMDFSPDQNQTNLSHTSLNFSQRHENASSPFDFFDKTNRDDCQSSHTPSRHPRHQPHHHSSTPLQPAPPPPPYELKSQSSASSFSNQTSFAEKECAPGIFNFQHFAKQITDTHLTSTQTDSRSRNIVDTNESSSASLTDLNSWNIGWDACALEALRYLVEDEGLPPHHPTVVAMKNHLDLQRARLLAPFTA